MSLEVLNQSPPLDGYDVFSADCALVEAVCGGPASGAVDALKKLGTQAGSAEWQQAGVLANTHPPVLRTHDRFGHRIDEVEFHPAWHQLLGVAIHNGLHASPWRTPQPGAHVARAAGFYVWSQVEAGNGCPVSMTHAAVPLVRQQPDLAQVWEPLFTSLDYDPRLRPASEKRGALCGMAMTEKQGGSDVRANTTTAERGDGGYLLTGHKWFCSAPMSDAFLVLAQTPAGLGCFFLPRVLPDGSRNAFFIQRLKDKLGNRSNASGEVEFERARAVLIGEEGRGVAVITEMVNATRLDCVLGTAALMRQALVQAIHHAGHRQAFGKRLVDQPVMLNVLADLALESEAATVLGLRLAAAVDHNESALSRLGTALGKYWVCKRGPVFVGEALECLGGNGYVEESVLPRLYREAPLNSIWEGPGNIQVLDILRILSRDATPAQALLEEVRTARGADRRLDAAVQAVEADLRQPRETDARRLAERLALLLQASLLVRWAPAEVAGVFCATRLDRQGGYAFGTLPAHAPARAIVQRAWPALT